MNEHIKEIASKEKKLIFLENEIKSSQVKNYASHNQLSYFGLTKVLEGVSKLAETFI